jgi:hypothetical protein
MSLRRRRPTAVLLESALIVASILLLLLVPASTVAQGIRGTVLDGSTGGPVSGVTVSLLEAERDRLLAQQLTERGTFTMPLTDAGSYRIRVEGLGYRTATTEVLEVAEGTVITVELRLLIDAVALQPLRIVAVRREPFWLENVRERQRLGFGTFLFRQELDQRADSELIQVIESLPGMFIDVVPTKVDQRTGITTRTTPVPVFRRAAAAGARTCYPLLYVSGAPVFRDSGVRDPDLNMWLILEEVMSIRAGDIEAIEVYRGPAQTPPEYATGDSECGVIAIWMRTGWEPHIGARPPAVPVPVVQVNASLGSYSFGGRNAPGAATTTRLAGTWAVRERVALTVAYATSSHTLSAGTTWELMRSSPDVFNHLYMSSYRLPPGERPLRLHSLTAGPTVRLRRAARVQPVVGAHVQFAYRGFLIESRAANRAPVKMAGPGVGLGGSAGVGIRLSRRVALESAAQFDAVRFRHYGWLDRSTAATWAGSGVRAGVVYQAGPRRH